MPKKLFEFDNRFEMAAILVAMPRDWNYFSVGLRATAEVKEAVDEATVLSFYVSDGRIGFKTHSDCSGKTCACVGGSRPKNEFDIWTRRFWPKVVGLEIHRHDSSSDAVIASTLQFIHEYITKGYQGHAQAWWRANDGRTILASVNVSFPDLVFREPAHLAVAWNKDHQDFLHPLAKPIEEICRGLKIREVVPATV